MQIVDYATVLTPETFEVLGRELNIRWPMWYRSLVLELLEHPRAHGDWLPGGFLYARPALIYRDTEAYRSGTLNLFGAAAPSGRLERLPWPDTYVIVGGYGNGSVLIDTATDQQILNNIDKETYSVGEFINISHAAESPEAFARMLHESDRQRSHP